MDKVETTEEISNFINFNKRDIVELNKEFPEIGNIFNQLLVAVDEKYGSGKIKLDSFTGQAFSRAATTQASTTTTQGSTTDWRTQERLFKAMPEEDRKVGNLPPEIRNLLMVEQILQGSEPDMNKKIQSAIIYSLSLLSEGFWMDMLLGNWNTYYLQPIFWEGEIDKIRSPLTALQELVAPMSAGTKDIWLGIQYWIGKEITTRNGKGIITKFEGIDKNNDFVVNFQIDVNGIKDTYVFTIVSLIDLYNGHNVLRYSFNKNQAGAKFKVGDFFQVPAGNTYEITRVDLKSNTIDYKETVGFYNGSIKIDKFTDAWKIIGSPDGPKRVKTFFENDVFYVQTQPGKEDVIKVQDIDDYSPGKENVTIELNGIELKSYNQDDIQEAIDKGVWKTNPTSSKSTKAPTLFIGDTYRYYTATDPSETFKITKKGTKNITVTNNTNDTFTYSIKNVEEFINTGKWIFLGNNYNAPKVTANVTIKVGNYFSQKTSQDDIYQITEIDEKKNKIKYKQVEGSGTSNFIYSSELKSVQRWFNEGTWILRSSILIKSGPPTTSKPLSSWTADWKAKGFRPSVQRSAAASEVKDIGYGYDGNWYEVVMKSNGVKGWSKLKGASYNIHNLPKNKITKEDLAVYIDQRNYELTLSDIDIDVRKDIAAEINYAEQLYKELKK